MALVPMKKLLTQAELENRAMGAFSVSNLEMILGAVAAAEETNTPIILQVAQSRLETSPLSIIGPAMLAAAKAAKVDIAVHLDHGLTLDVIQEALDIGFTSVMYDGSKLSLEENITNTKKVMAMARPYGATVEAEIGRVGGAEADVVATVQCADIDESIRFARETGVDALAVGIGNMHGVYKGAPELHFEVLEGIRRQVATPLVLHGGTGISEADFKKAISLGIRKINIATETFRAVTAAATGADTDNFFELSRLMRDAGKAVALRHIHLFGVH